MDPAFGDRAGSGQVSWRVTGSRVICAKDARLMHLVCLLVV